MIPSDRRFHTPQIEFDDDDVKSSTFKNTPLQFEIESSMHKTLPLPFVVLLASIFVSGCGGSHGPAPVVTKKVKPASGTITIDGKAPGQVGDPTSMENPPHQLVMKLWPKVPQLRADTPSVTAEVGDDGKYSFSTYVQGDGVEAGEYILTWESLKVAPLTRNLSGPDRFLNNFNNPLEQDPKYTIKVEEGKDFSFTPIDVKLADIVAKEPSPFATPTGAFSRK